MLDLLGEANGPLISNNEVKLRVLTQISTGENLLIYEGFYLDGRVPLGGGIDESFRRAVWIFIISRSRQLAESSPCSPIPQYLLLAFKKRPPVNFEPARLSQLTLTAPCLPKKIRDMFFHPMPVGIEGAGYWAFWDQYLFDR